jgi:phage/plasmid-like protein (TIGR03299 family)
MSHQIEIFEDGTAAAAFGRQSAWHQLGTVFEDEMTPEQALAAAQLTGWNVRLVNLTGYELTDDGVSSVDVQDYFGIARTHPKTGQLDILGCGVAAGWTPYQNEQLMVLLDELSDNARISAVGSLQGGKRVFACVKLPQTVLVGDLDSVDLYLTLYNGHDGNLALTGFASPIRSVCANTIHAGLAAAVQRWKIRHTSGIRDAAAKAQQSLQLTYDYMKAFEAEADRMIQEKITRTEFDAIIRRVFDDPDAKGLSDRARTMRRRKVDAVHAIHHSRTTNMIAGTRWGAYNAITEYVDHGDGRQSRDQAEARAMAAVTGNAHRTRRAGSRHLLAVLL